MHKIKKGIKKKIKGKKGKDKEDDLFDPEQLAKYKEELDKAAAEKAATAAAAAEAAGGDPDYSPTQDEPSCSGGGVGGGGEGHEGDDEWKKFKLLTSGVDSVLKKTSGDLDRIKSSSYFQRVPPKSTLIFPPSSSSSATTKSGQNSRSHPQQQLQSNAATPQQQAQFKNSKKEGGRWVNVERGGGGGSAAGFESEGEAHDEHKGDSVKSPEQGEKEEEEKPAESPEPIEVDDDLFDTSFVDKVEAGDLKLSYVPDSPDKEEVDGDDPFDTSAVADVVKKIEEEEKRQKKKVNLGLAVNVLTGKEGETSSSTGSTNNNNSRQAKVKDSVVSRGGDSSKKKRRPRPHHINLLGSFDGNSVVGLTQLSPSDKTQKSSPPADSLLDTILASSPPPSDILGDVVVPFVTDSGGEPTSSDHKTDESHHQKEEEGGLNLKELLSEFDVISEDVVDSSSTTKGKKESINLAEALNENNDDDDLEDEFAALAVESLHKEGSGGPTAPPNKESPQVLTPTSPDPFDTTHVDIPEDPSEVKNDDENDDDDFDFNPRADEPEGLEPTVCTAPSDSSNLLVQQDLLGGSSSDLTALLTSVDPIHPVSDGLIETEVHDPFDTSVVDGLLPGKAELKLLEEELLQDVEGEGAVDLTLQNQTNLPSILQQQPSVKSIVDDFDDDDFDPRQGEPTVVAQQQQQQTPTVVVHHPKGPQRPPPPVKVPEIHPLDLDHSSAGLDSGSVVDTSKTLTPQNLGEQGEEEEEIEIDPFDTSSVPADVILPGKLELKLLESELAAENSNKSNTSGGGSVLDSNNTDDFDFDPRKEEKPIVRGSIGIDDIHDIFDDGDDFFQAQPLQPTTANSSNVTSSQQQQQTGDNLGDNQDDPSIFGEDEADPFDTSSFVKENILPGKAELKLLEKELLTGAEDFQPPSLPKIPIVYQSTIVQQPPQPPPPLLSEQPTLTEQHQQHHQQLLETQQSLHPLEIDDDHEEGHSFAPLQPSQLTDPSLDIDPFDTSIANSIVPGKAELKILEAELDAFDPTQRRLSDPDFNPRQNPVYPTFNLNSISAPLIPQTVLQPTSTSSSAAIEEEDDPFDTSVANTILPGKTELKILEAELL